jgi:PatG C-terminal
MGSLESDTRHEPVATAEPVARSLEPAAELGDRSTEYRRAGPRDVELAATDAPTPAATRDAGGFVYAIGQIDARYPSLGVEREFNQVAALTDASGLTERQLLKQIIAQDSNRYLARSLCWLLLVGGLETYILAPRDPADFKLLIDAYRDKLDPGDVDVVIGVRGPIAPPDACNGVAVPIVAFDQLYSFTRKTLVDAIPLPNPTTDEDAARFRADADDVFGRIIQMADNAGATDDHRALNYLAVRYPRVYTKAAEAHARNESVTGVEVRPSRLSGVRDVVDVIFSYTDRQTDVVEKWFARVDVTEEYPFLVTKLSQFFES